MAGFINAQTVIDFKLTQPEELLVNIGDDVTINEGETVDIGSENSISGGTPDYYYYWSPGDYMEDRDKKVAQVTPEETIKYVFHVTDARNCQSTDTLEVKVAQKTATEEANIAEGLSIYPNPAVRYFKVNKAGTAESVTVKLLTVSGEVLFTETVEGAQIADKEFALPEGQGIYLVNIASGNINRTFQLIVNEGSRLRSN